MTKVFNQDGLSQIDKNRQSVFFNWCGWCLVVVFLSCSDLALRNCLLTSDLTVRIGDYGLSHNHYKVCGCFPLILNRGFSSSLFCLKWCYINNSPLCSGGLLPNSRQAMDPTTLDCSWAAGGIQRISYCYWPDQDQQCVVGFKAITAIYWRGWCEKSASTNQAGYGQFLWILLWSDSFTCCLIEFMVYTVLIFMTVSIGFIASIFLFTY